MASKRGISQKEFKRSVKVLFIAHHLKAAGTERQLIYLMRGLIERGIPLSLLVFDPVGEFIDEIPDKVKVYYPLSPKPRKSLETIWKIKEITRVVYRERPDILYSRQLYVKPPTAFAGRLLRKKVIIAEVNSVVRYLTNKGGKKRLLKKVTYHLADVIVAISQGVADELEQVFNIHPFRVRLIYNGLDVEEIERKSREEVSHPWFHGEEPVAAAVGRLVNQKGFSYLLEAVELVNRKTPLRLIILGDGELKEELRKQAQELGIGDKVDLIGVKRNPFAYMAQCDLFVLSSLSEGFPNVLIEAMALGLPVISTRCPTGPGEIIEDGRSGILVPVGDPQAIADAILRVLADKQLRHRLAVEARTRARDFPLENMISKYSELFLSLSDNASPYACLGRDRD